MSKTKNIKFSLGTIQDTESRINSLINTMKNTILRLGGSIHNRDRYNGMTELAILGIATDALEDAFVKLINDSDTLKKEVDTLKDTKKSALKSACDKVVNTINSHFTRSNTTNEATEMTKGYNLFADDKTQTPTIFRAYLDNDRILEVKTTSGSLTNTRTTTELIALAESARIMNYGGDTINDLYNAQTAICKHKGHENAKTNSDEGAETK